MKPTEIEKMTVREKLEAMEALWNSLDDDDIESPEWHGEVLNERKKILESGQAKFMSLDELKKIKAYGKR